MRQVANKDFNFEAKVFQAPGAFFGLASGTKEPLLYVQMGENLAGVGFDALRTNFDIAANSEDDHLLNLVQASLQFVKRIRPGDSIPSEVLDGTASWAIEAHHRQLVDMRLTVALARWLMKDTSTAIDMRTLIKIAEDPDTKKNAQTSIDEIAEATGVGKENRQQIIDKIEQLKDELSYIEALKEHFQAIPKITDKIKQSRALLQDDRGLCDEIDRIVVLINEPMKKYAKLFRSLESETDDILELVKNYSNKVNFIRHTRDDLRAALLDWEELIDKWRDQLVEPNCGLESLVRFTYRFVATNFPMTQSWRAG